MRQRLACRPEQCFGMLDMDSHITHMNNGMKSCRNQWVSKNYPTLLTQWAPSMPVLAAGAARVQHKQVGGEGKRSIKWGMFRVPAYFQMHDNKCQEWLERPGEPWARLLRQWTPCRWWLPARHAWRMTALTDMVNASSSGCTSARLPWCTSRWCGTTAY